MASISEARSNFNLKVLRRHDPSIVEIIETASFVVLYNYNSGEWTKTGVEGPLFLFRRRLPPYNGFFLMNRNGVENFSADVTPEDDLEITPEFIIYRPETTNEVYGIWVFEANQRMSVGDKLLKLQQMTDGPSEEVVKKAMAGDKETVAASTGGEEKGKGAEKEKQQESGKNAKGKANGKPKKNAKAAQAAAEKNNDSTTTTAAPVAEETEAGTQISLDDLFGSATAPTQPSLEATEATREHSAAETEQPTSSNGASLLDSLFQSASLHSTPNATPAAASGEAIASKSAASPPKPADKDHAQNPLSLLGGNTANGRSESPAPTTTTQPSAPLTEQKEAGGAPKMSDLIEAGIKDRIGLGDDGQPLSRREFVTELLSMVHTNPDFVSELYGAYVARVQ